MPAASLETTLELWLTTLRQAKHRIRSLFAAPSVAASANAFLDGLLGAERRKTGWMRAEAAGDPGPWRQQAILGRSHWNADALRDVVRDHVIETLGAPEAVLVIDETGFLKQGHASCGVGRQYTGSAGKITNCQIGVFAAYVSDKGHAFIDRQLYLPKAWTSDPARMTAAHVPAGITFATKPHLALGMVERAIAAGVPFAWVTADTVYGVGEIELALRRADKGYVLGVTSQHSFWSWGAEAEVSGTAEEIATALGEEDWIRLSAGAGDDVLKIGKGREMPVGKRLIQNKPEVLGGLKLGGAWGRVDGPDPVRHGQVGRGVPAGVVELKHEDAIPSRPSLARKQGQQRGKERLGHPVRYVPEGLAGDRLHEGGDVQPLIAVVTERDRPLTLGRPHPAQDRLQPDAVLVRGPDLNRFVRVLSARLSDGLLELFLNASRSSGVAAAGWRGRGFCTDQPIAFRASQPR